MESHSSVSRVQRVRYELRRRDVEVVRARRISPSFIAVTFTGDALSDFVSGAFDDHVKLVFPDDAGEPVRRDYTPRTFDPASRELTIEFALHGEGKASDWAWQAAAGQQAVIGGPKGSMIIPDDVDWHLLVGDTTALPAIHRRLDELAPDAHVIAMIHVADAADQRQFGDAARRSVQWFATADDLVQAMDALQLPPGEGFVWGAGEASMMGRVRQILTAGKSHPREAMRLAAYWKRGSEHFHETLGD